MKKVVDFTQFEEKMTHINLCIIVHLCTIAIVPVHICTGTVALPFNILMFLFVILMFYLYGIKSKMNQTATCLSFHWASHNIIMENYKKLMKNEYFIEISCKIDKLM